MQQAALFNEANHIGHTLLGFEVTQHKGLGTAHAPRVVLHDLQVSADVRREVVRTERRDECRYF